MKLFLAIFSFHHFDVLKVTFLVAWVVDFSAKQAYNLVDILSLHIFIYQRVIYLHLKGFVLKELWKKFLLLFLLLHFHQFLVGKFEKAKMCVGI